MTSIGLAERTSTHSATFSEHEIAAEAERLHERLRVVGWGRLECELVAPLTLEINRLKRTLNAVILAHSYQTPDIIYGIADHVGDSLGLSQEAAKSEADVVIFCGVRFMAETAKILCPEKTVLHPAPDAGCSLSESITAEDVRRLKAEHPGVPVICYVNTSAEVKAESDACCTSANGLAVIESFTDADTVIFIPDQYMAANLQPHTSKKLIAWHGSCIVHEQFGPQEAKAFRAQFPDAALLAHTECLPSVADMADMVGSTSGMETYIAKHPERRRFMLMTECGMTERLKVQFPERDFVGSCVLCPHMKKVELRRVLESMTEPGEDQVVNIDPQTIERARKSLERMLSIGRSERVS